MLSLIIPTFIAGLLMFFAPCTLPLVPAYLFCISGIPASDLQNPQKKSGTRRKIFMHGLFFVAGFTVVFITMGILAGFLGSVLMFYRFWLETVGGVFIIIFGLFAIGAIKIPFLDAERKFSVPVFFQRWSSLNSFVLGAAFASGWTPCVGPILGSVLLLASTSGTVLTGAALLFVFSLGLSLPLLALAAGIGSAIHILARFSRFAPVISFIGGVFLIILGFLLVMHLTPLLVVYGFRWFDFINYAKFLDYL